MSGIIGGVGLVAIVAVTGFVIVYTGAYNVAASDEHADFIRWAFSTTMHSSVERRADGIAAPESFSDDMIAAGASRYKAMCAHCHAGPGVERADWAEGMRPQPPHLIEAAAEWEAREIYWIVANGIKMSGMPAFAASHDPEELWSLVAFVDRLPGMTAEDYAGYPDPDESSQTR
ncbi:c-type cytochrome [Acuticoccus sediminis]|uniref:c-type cytochrome n=1 Tax=Acuticoccus sediminis TaxID=2184697 RepID=UPI00192E50AC|nr:cytochrome c [Acuticoccus sediminis]